MVAEAAAQGILGDTRRRGTCAQDRSVIEVFAHGGRGVVTCVAPPPLQCSTCDVSKTCAEHTRSWPQLAHSLG